MVFVAALAASLIAMVLAAIFAIRHRRRAPAQAARGMVVGLISFNVVLGLMVAGLGIAWLALPPAALAAVVGGQQDPSDPYASPSAALATGLAAIGAAIAVSNTGSAAVSTITEKPEAFGRSLVFVGLAEGIAIYGLIISFMILRR